MAHTSRRLVLVLSIALLLSVALKPAHAASWMGSSPPITATFNGVAAWDPLTAIVVGESEGGVAYRTIDAGKTWTSEITQNFPGILAVKRVPGTSNAVAVGRQAVLWETTSKGSWWSNIVPVGINPFADLYGVSYISAQTGWVVGSSGLIYRTNDWSSNWTQQTSGVTTRLNNVDFVDANTGFVVGDSGVILRTTNGGSTWTSIPVGGASTNYYGVDFIDSQTGWVVGANGVILQTTNGGSTWTVKSPESAGTSVTFRAVSFADSQKGMFVGSGGVIFTTANGGATIVQESIGSSPYLYAATHVDGADRWVAGQSVVRHYDAISPEVGLVMPFSATAGVSTSFSLYAADNLGTIAGCALYVDGVNRGNMLVSDTHATLSYTFSSAGTFSVAGQCVDTAGNTTMGNATAVVVSAPVQQTQPDVTPHALVSAVYITGNTTVLTNGSDLTTVWVVVRNAAGIPLGGKVVSISSSRGSLDTLSATQVSTNSSGQASFEVRSRTPGVSVFTARTEGVTLATVATVTFSAPVVSSPTTSGGGGGGSYSPFSVTPSGLVPGDLFRGTVKSPYGGYPVYYYTAQGKKSLFPSEATYKTWYSDFVGVKVISQIELESIVGADKNVTVRPGLSVVRFESDSGLYVVEPGAVIRRIDEDAGGAIYGAGFQVLQIQNAFRANYRSGNAVSSAVRYDRTASLNAAPSIASEMAR